MPDNTYQRLMEGNQKFVETTLHRDPSFFEESAKGQSPKVLWIGCADSRVPAAQVTGALPGELFVHRNIANVVVHTDMNCLSVMEYAIKVLEVEHVVVCGHYGCGGVAAAISPNRHGMIDQWLTHIKDVYRLHAKELETLSGDAQAKRLVELNVIEQVASVCATSIVQEAWAKRKAPQVHGFVYDLASGKLKDLEVTAGGPEALAGVYGYELRESVGA